MIVPITCAVKLVGVVARRKSAVEADLRKIAALACGSRQEDYSKIVIVFVRIFTSSVYLLTGVSLIGRPTR